MSSQKPRAAARNPYVHAAEGSVVSREASHLVRKFLTSA